ncbi:esterase [Trichoderma compactum]
MATSPKSPVIIEKPLINCRLVTHQVPIEDIRKDPSKYMIDYGHEIIDDGNLIITEEKCPVNGDEITIRIFQPGNAISSEKRPAYVNFHGGGWTFGGLTTDYDFCKRLVLELGCVAFDVDYRLAPEYKFPIPIDDYWAALNWIRDVKSLQLNVNLDKIAVGGVSAGGIPLAFQLLGAPVCDIRVFTSTRELRPDCEYDSYREMYHAPPLPAKRMMFFHKCFVGNPRPAELGVPPLNWKVSPIEAPNFKNLAPALIWTAEMDVLRDEGEAYGRKMNDAGSKAEIIRLKGAPHNFAHLDAILESGKTYNRESIRALRDAFGGSSRCIDSGEEILLGTQ